MIAWAPAPPSSELRRMVRDLSAAADAARALGVNLGRMAVGLSRIAADVDAMETAAAKERESDDHPHD